MPETQIRRADGSDTTIPELLQELAAKEAAGAGSVTPKSLHLDGRSTPEASAEGMGRRAAPRAR